MITVTWKGLVYEIPLHDLTFSSYCCNDKVLKIQIDIFNNTFQCYPITYVPILIQSGKKIKNGGYNIGFGYLKMPLIDFNNIFEYTDKQLDNISEDTRIQISRDNISKYYILPFYAKNNTNIQDVRKNLTKYLNNNFNLINIERTYNQITKNIIQVKTLRKIIYKTKQLEINIFEQHFFSNIYFS